MNKKTGIFILIANLILSRLVCNVFGMENILCIGISIFNTFFPIAIYEGNKKDIWLKKDNRRGKNQ